LREELATIEGAGAQLLAIDPHEVWSAKFLLKETGLGTDDLQYPLLMDPAVTVSATYGVAFQMRIHVEISNRPATFLIDRDGVLRYAHRGTRFNDRPTPAEVIAEIKKLEFSGSAKP
jgi:peroxiredoxin